METAVQNVAQQVPEALRTFLGDTCAIHTDEVRMLPGSALPQPARQLLVHHTDMTSTLAAFHGSALRVDRLQHRQIDSTHLREVFLRTASDDRVVEYGIIAIALGQFTAAQQLSIAAGRVPLGRLLHEFKIPFASNPIGFFSVATAALAECRHEALRGATCFGRFNRLSRRGGEPLAWIMEVLPAA